ncbi:hypothetical protein R1sor_006083 [Riccia sorocarpa]|uniref:Uncharacterized protein n=1 Tax=Riccia sorocarpa TaxID=122646 RepID=A0ABD3HLM2_9MARC
MEMHRAGSRRLVERERIWARIDQASREMHRGKADQVSTCSVGIGELHRSEVDRVDTCSFIRERSSAASLNQSEFLKTGEGIAGQLWGEVPFDVLGSDVGGRAGIDGIMIITVENLMAAIGTKPHWSGYFREDGAAVSGVFQGVLRGNH